MKTILITGLLTAGALMPSASFGSSITGIVEGQADGLAWNHTIGGTTSCSYGFSSNISSGNCTYISTGLINAAPWAGQTNSYTADVYSSVDLTNGSLHAYAGQSVANYPIDTEVDSGFGASSAFDADAIAYASGGSSDFSDTAQIVGIVLEDMSGNELNGYTVQSQSGINYDALLAGDPGGAPEPATWALAGGSILIIGLGMRRRAVARAGEQPVQLSSGLLPGRDPR